MVLLCTRPGKALGPINLSISQVASTHSLPNLCQPGGISGMPSLHPIITGHIVRKELRSGRPAALGRMQQTGRAAPGAAPQGHAATLRTRASAAPTRRHDDATTRRHYAIDSAEGQLGTAAPRLCDAQYEACSPVENSIYAIHIRIQFT